MPIRSTILFIGLLAPAIGFGADPPKPQNELISDFIDNTEKYKGKTVTFRVTLVSANKNLTIRDRLGDKSVPFKSEDPKNGARLGLGLDIPKDLKVPVAKAGEEVIVRFKCTEGKTDKGNVAVEIVRP